MAETYSNAAPTTLASGINTSVTSLTVATGTGSTYPTTGDFRVLIGSELIVVGARSGDTFSSLTRGVEGTTAASHSTGDVVTHVLTAGGLAAIVGGGGGGGGGVSQGSLASRPAAGSAGTLYLPTDAPYQFVDNGSSWDAYFMGRKVRCPSDLTRAWVNQTFGSQSSAEDVAHGYSQISRQLSGSGQISARAWAHGLTPPWRLLLTFDWSGPNAAGGGTSSGHFVGFRDSVGGKLIIMQAWMELNQYRLDYLNSPTSFNTNQVGGNNWTSYDRLGPPYGFILSNDNTNLTIELASPFSYKGRTYYSAGKTSFLAAQPDQVIWGIYDNTTSGELSYTTLYGIADA